MCPSNPEMTDLDLTDSERQSLRALVVKYGPEILAELVLDLGFEIAIEEDERDANDDQR